MVLPGSDDTLEQIITSSGILGSRSPSGWYTLRCLVCNDKKSRGGWKFEGGSASYHCFNCSTTAGYKAGAGRFSEKMVTVLSDFGLLDSAKSVLFSAFAAGGRQVDSTQHIPANLAEASQIELPTFFRPLDPTRDTAYVDYLRTRALEPSSHEFMVSDKIGGKWQDRLIVLCRNQANQVTFFQGRDITGNSATKRWESPIHPKTNVLFNYNSIPRFSEDDIVVCEGSLDALSVSNGVAILGSTFSKYHVHKLTQARGRKIIVPNKDANGAVMAKQALSVGFSLSFPDIGSCSDLNEALRKYGSMYLESAITQGIVDSEFSAQMKLGHWVS